MEAREEGDRPSISGLEERACTGCDGVKGRKNRKAEGRKDGEERGGRG